MREFPYFLILITVILKCGQALDDSTDTILTTTFDDEICMSKPQRKLVFNSIVSNEREFLRRYVNKNCFQPDIETEFFNSESFLSCASTVANNDSLAAFSYVSPKCKGFSFTIEECNLAIKTEKQEDFDMLYVEKLSAEKPSGPPGISGKWIGHDTSNKISIAVEIDDDLSSMVDSINVETYVNGVFSFPSNVEVAENDETIIPGDAVYPGFCGNTRYGFDDVFLTMQEENGCQINQKMKFERDACLIGNPNSSYEVIFDFCNSCAMSFKTAKFWHQAVEACKESTLYGKTYQMMTIDSELAMRVAKYLIGISEISAAWLDMKYDYMTGNFYLSDGVTSAYIDDFDIVVRGNSQEDKYVIMSITDDGLYKIEGLSANYYSPFICVIPSLV